MKVVACAGVGLDNVDAPAATGLGKIGQLVAQRLAACGVELIAYDPYVAPARAVPGRGVAPTGATSSGQ